MTTTMHEESVRNFGRNLAQKHGMIVQVGDTISPEVLGQEIFIENGSEWEIILRRRTVDSGASSLPVPQDDDESGVPLDVDLSSLNELVGIQSPEKFSTSAARLPPRTAGKSNPASYFFPEETDEGNWKPVSMHPIYLLVIAFSSAAIAVGQDMLFRYSRERDGLITFSTPQDLTTFQYFLWRYLPTIIMVIFGMCIQTTDFQVKRLDPFYRLACSNGVDSYTLLRDPVSYWTHLRHPASAGSRIWVSSLTTILATIVVPVLQNASLLIGQDSHSTKSYVYVRKEWSRLLTSTLGAISVGFVVLAILLQTRSGLLCSPDGFTSIAAMLTKSHILQDFEHLDLASDQSIHIRLKNRRFVLYRGSIWQGEWRVNGDKVKPSKLDHAKPQRLVLERKISWPLCGLALLIQVITPIVIFSPANYLIQRLPWILTALGVILKQLWVQLDAFTRRTEPYWHLSNGNAPGSILSVEYNGTLVLTLPFKAFRNGHYHLAFLGLNNILVEMLVVCLASFGLKGSHFYHHPTTIQANNAQSDPETFVSFWISYALTVAILSSMILSMTLIWIQRRKNWLPRLPGGIASIITYFASSNMLNDMIDVEVLTTSEHRKRLEARGKRYGLGWFIGRDGQPHVSIDHEPMRAKYVPYVGPNITKAIGTEQGLEITSIG